MGNEVGDGYICFDSHWEVYPHAEHEQWMAQETSVKGRCYEQDDDEQEADEGPPQQQPTEHPPRQEPVAGHGGATDGQGVRAIQGT